jgi:hypothetical protein
MKHHSYIIVEPATGFGKLQLAVKLVCAAIASLFGRKVLIELGDNECTQMTPNEKS